LAIGERQNPILLSDLNVGCAGRAELRFRTVDRRAATPTLVPLKLIKASVAANGLVER